MMTKNYFKYCDGKSLRHCLHNYLPLVLVPESDGKSVHVQLLEVELEPLAIANRLVVFHRITLHRNVIH